VASKHCRPDPTSFINTQQNSSNVNPDMGGRSNPFRMFRYVDPKSVQVNLTAGSGVVIEWQDGHRSEYSFRFLHDACPCANCVALRAMEDRRPGEPKQLKQGELLPIIRPVPKLKRVEPVRNYAIRLHWDDGHAEGNYSWEFLREICPCAECRVPKNQRKIA
jgi:DUF971 family protein